MIMELPPSTTGSIFRVSSISTLSTIFFCSDLILASRLGVSATAFFYRPTVPAIVINYCNAVGSALVPVLARHFNCPLTENENLLTTVFNVILLALSGVVILGIIFAPNIITIIGPGLDDETAKLGIILHWLLSQLVFFRV
jgi:peptidoglycan biosynthesis protein MviN/MurJ (putative lipid II flippase)